MAAARRPADRLPAETTTFVGRRRELEQAAHLLRTARLLSLIGVGGVGKTRLAMRIAAHAAEHLDDAVPGGVGEVRLVDLATLDDPVLVPATVAEALGVRDESGTLTAESLAARLDDHPVLVVLDSCEHLVDACAALVETLLRSAGSMTVLATSRQPLGVAGEHILAVAPLDPPQPNEHADLTAMAGSPAIALFLDRARAALPGFALTRDDAGDVAAVCEALDGLPLAIELAAVRIRALSPAELLERLERRHRFLSSATRAGQPRQRSITALMDWSYRLCGETERLLWARISVFNGGFDLEAAEDVCSDDLIDADDVVDLVVALVEKSILLREDHGGRTRYRVLETIRRYGRDRLIESGEEEWALRQHRNHMQRMVDDAAAQWFGPDDLTLLGRLRTEHANLRAALDGCTRSPEDAEAGLRLATTFWLMWRSAGWVSEGRQWLDRLLDQAPARSPITARALWVDGWLALVQGDHDRAVELLGRSETIADGLDDDEARGFTDLFLGQAAMQRGALEEADQRLRRSLDLHRGTGDPAGIALTTFRLAVLQAAAGDGDGAVATAELGLQLCHESGARWWSGNARWVKAVALWCRGNAAGAVDEAIESMTIAWEHGDELTTAMALAIVAWGTVDISPRRAAYVLGALDGRWPRPGSALAGYGNLIDHQQACHERTRRLLGPDLFADEHTRGAAQRIATVVEDVMRDNATSPSDVGRGGVVLTRRELQVAELVALGRTNKEIAKSLIIAQRTAETHVEHIRTKLGATSRAQIAAWVVERRMTPTA